MTHEYTLLLGGTVLPGIDREPVSAIAWAHDTILAIGSDADVRAISRGDSTMVDLEGRFVVPLQADGSASWPPSRVLELGSPADLAIVAEDPRGGAAGELACSAVVRAGRVVSGSLQQLVAAAASASAFTIRPATPDDAAAEAELEHESAIHHATVDPDRWRVPAPEDVASHRRHWAAAKPRDAGFVAEADGHVVGMIELWFRRPLAITGNARIPRLEVNLGIAVAAAWRSRGVGTALLEAGEAWAREQGAERMSLWVDAANTGARRLYERIGYAPWGLEMDKAIEPEKTALDAASIVRNHDGEVVPTLVGERVTLRPLRPEDRPAIIELLRDPTIAAIWDTRGPEHSADELLAGDANFTVWAIEVDGQFAGSIQASEEPDEDYRHAGIDIFVSSRFQDRGLGTDALRTLVHYLIQIRGHHRLTIDPAASNARAIRSYEKVGFRPVGVMRRYERGKDGTYHDGLLMDLLAEELD